MNFPIAVKNLDRALPHRPPMVWVDWVLAADKDGGTCAVDLKPEALYAGKDGWALPFAPIEWLAQAYGYARACHEVASGSDSSGARRAFLAGITEVELSARIPTTGRILLEVRLIRELPPLALVDGVVRSESGDVLAKARLKLYFEF